MKAGDKVNAIEGTVAAMFAEGRIGTVAEARDPVSYRGNTTRNLIRWGDEDCLLGFRPEEVTPAELTSTQLN